MEHTMSPKSCRQSQDVNPLVSSRSLFQDIRWRNLIILSVAHLATLVTILDVVLKMKMLTWIWSFFTGGVGGFGVTTGAHRLWTHRAYKARWPLMCTGTFFTGGVGGFGVTAGAHRLWTHRAYKARWPLRVLLLMCYSTAGHNPLFDWVRDHRVHHKHSETDADPHNAKRGFFFAHVGWLLQRKHPAVIEKGSSIDMSDVLNDPVADFHRQYYVPMQLLFCFAIPILTPRFLWDETWYVSILSAGISRWIFTLNFTWLVNSAAHIWGNKPYDRRIMPAENRFVSVVAMGEGWHNYHHVFPWDYKAAELGDYTFNITTFWIEVFAKLGWAYDLKVPSPTLVQTMMRKYGDGTRAQEAANDPLVEEACASSRRKHARGSARHDSR